MFSDEIMRINLDEIFNVLRTQEENTYKCANYLTPEFKLNQAEQFVNKPSSDIFPPDASVCSSMTSSTSVGVNEVWREKICEWSYQVIDHFDFNREIVSVSLNYLDRYLNTRMVNKKIFQLAAMTSLYIAIKLYEPGTLKISSLIELSRGYFAIDHIATMEQTILRALSWHVHPPTPLCFTRHLLLLFPQNSPQIVMHEVMELSQFLTELSVCDFFFVSHKPSSIALAALLNAIEGVNEVSLPRSFRRKFINSIRNVAGLSYNSTDVERCRIRLRDMYFKGGYYEKYRLSGSSETDYSEYSEVRMMSPVCVADVHIQQTQLSNYYQSNNYALDTDNVPNEDAQTYNYSGSNATLDDGLDVMDISNICGRDTRTWTETSDNVPESRKSCKTASKSYPGGLHSDTYEIT